MIASFDDVTRKQSVAGTPFALVLVLHLLLVMLWASTGQKAVEQGAEQRHFTLTWIPVLRPRETLQPSPPLTRAEKVAAPAVKLRASANLRPSLVAPTIDAESIPVGAEMPQRSTGSDATAPDALDAKKMIDIAKRQAGLIDNELRVGKPAPLAPDPDLPVARFRTQLDRAFIDGSTSMVTESQTQPDGVVVYRFRRGGRVWCRQSGGSGPSSMEYSDGAKLAGAGSRGGSGAAGTIACPSEAHGWSRL